MTEKSSYTGLSPSALGVLKANALIQCAFILLPAAAVFFILDSRVLAAVSYALLAVLCVIYYNTIPKFRHSRYRYSISRERIDIVEGVLFVSHKIVPVDRIHQVEIAYGPVDAKFGVAKVIVTTAGSTAEFRFLEKEKAEAVADTLNIMIRDRLKNARLHEGQGLSDSSDIDGQHNGSHGNADGGTDV